MIRQTIAIMVATTHILNSYFRFCCHFND